MTLWGAAVNIGQWSCPLTYVERWLRRRAVSPTFQRGFLERYITPLVYPRALDAVHFILLGTGLLLLNALIYGYLYRSGKLDRIVNSIRR